VVIERLKDVGFFAEVPILVNSLLAALVASVLIVIQCYLSGSRPAFAYPGYLVFGVTAILALFALPGRLTRPGRWCLAVTAIFFGYLLTRAALSPVPYLARQDFFLSLAALIVYSLTALFITGTTERLSIVWLLLLLAGFEAVVGTRQFAGNDWLPFGLVRRATEETVRASGTFINPANLAGFLEIMAPLALAIAFWGTRRLWARLLAGYFAVVCFFGIAISGSRGGWVSTGFSMVIFVILSRDLIRRTSRSRFPMALSLSVVAALSLAGGAIYFMRSNVVLKRRLDLVSELTDQKKVHDIRVYNWLAALDQWNESRWFGTGAGTHLYFGRKYRHEELQSDPVHAHSDYLELLAEYGLAGFAALIPFLFLHARSGWRGYQQWSARRAEDRYPPSPELALNIGALCAFAAYLAHSMVDFNLHLPGNALTMAFIFGLLANPGTPEDPVDSEDPELPHSARQPQTRWPRLALPLLGAGLLFTLGTKWRGEMLSEKARVCVRDRQYDDAVIFARASLQYDSRNPYTYKHLGDAYRLKATAARIGRPGEAITLAEDAYRHAITLFNDELVFWIAIGQTLDAEAKYAEARVAYERAVALDPLFWMPRGFLAMHFAKIGDSVRETSMWYSSQRLVGFDVKKYFAGPARNSGSHN
jgi:O-antigen ligase